MRILAIDLGYSNVKIAYYDENGILQLDKYISALAKVDNPMEIDDDVMFRFGINYYILGTPALKVPRSSLLNLETFDDLKTAYPIWISYILKKYGGVDKFDKVIIGLSMAWADKCDELLDYLYEALLMDKTTDYFMCMSQGFAAKGVYNTRGLDLREVSKNNDSKMRNYLILDGGYETIDIASVQNGTASAGATVGIPNTGLICVSYDIIDYLFKEYEMKMSIKEAQTVVDSGGKFVRRNKEYDISAKLDEFIKKYINNVLIMLEDKYSESLDSIEGILVCGGFAYFLKKYLEDPEVINMIEKHFPLSFLKITEDSSEFYNVVGYLDIAQKIL